MIVLTANPHYAMDRARPGMRMTTRLRRRLHVTRPFRIGLNQWYVIPRRFSPGVFKVRQGVIQEVGVFARAFSHGRKAESRLLHSFRNP